eukprot:CAMPEP_0195026780 /NCGR_PEP_ID=MMETSP0326_2-20130528/51030_1 /TAXON_ID=2866 ORGANISM="Crypthecodinium cohnii, Strain Seligo" /NCGR_SAMPLE_ID=MMETSP0326_2 /ASSEMBLY_ACC=CAM_ASM_000348 /LENGTH=51 /DNA_ID=CAMNT_0040048773 /DNA_START=51 /DNA_END=203 /DNA_ORIENTATION=+
MELEPASRRLFATTDARPCNLTKGCDVVPWLTWPIHRSMKRMEYSTAIVQP